MIQTETLTHGSKRFPNEDGPLCIGPDPHVFPFDGVPGFVLLREVSAQLDQTRVYYLRVEGFPQFKKHRDVKVNVERGKERSHDRDHDEDGLEG